METTTTWGKVLAVVGALVAAGAGLYLLTSSSQSGQTVFDVMMHGIGAYFIARGIWMIARLGIR